MSKELFVSSTPHETKVAIVEDDQLTEVYYERENEYTLAGSIYKGRVTRVLPGMQSAFVNVGLERDAFLYVSDFLLEEEEDADALEQVVARSRPEIHEPEARAELQQSPIEAEEIILPAEPADEEEAEEPPAVATEKPSEGQPADGEEREGARRWRGRRRRGRGRDRFGDRERTTSEHPERSTDRSVDRSSERSTDRAERGTSHIEAPQESHAQQANPFVLPGESISKYQPHGTTQPAPEPVVSPAPQHRPKPSTEYAVDASKFSPGSMTLPGESIAKYRHESRPASAVMETPQTTVEQQHQPQNASPASLVEPAEASQYSQEVDAEPAHIEAASDDRLGASVEESSATIDESEQQRMESMNVASVFGGDAVEEPSISQTIQPGEHFQEPASGDQEKPEPASVNSWRAGGLVEEEEIEEEETELPSSFEEHFEIGDFEELEEEELARAEDDALGSALTEAVRDAHVNERATGQYEAEGLEGSAEFDEAEVFAGADAEEDEEGAEPEFEETEGQADEPEAARAEMRGPTGTAGYQQRADRRGDRRNRKIGRRMRGRPRHHVQRHLPAISDLLKEGQEILVQIAKEPIAKKGARITSHIALPGRFLVYMPTVHHTGVSRKIASEEERQRLKRIVLSERGDAHGGFIVRTAAAGANEDDLRADIRFLINLWNEIRGRAEKSKAPSLIYHDLNLVERILRDQVTVSFSSIWVDSEQEYERILRFVSRFQPSLVKRVKLYTKETPLFEQFSITDEINKALKSKVWLKSGGYIVINQTEALVAIDVNTGKYVGKTTRLEDTIVKTNIDAIREIVRQIRLRDLGGIIVIDFIDMDERKNRQKVMQALEEALKADRAPSKVLQFNDFGLVAITRKRVKQSLERTLGQQCPVCTGTGMIKSVTTICNEIYVEMKKMARHFERDIMLRANPEVAKALKSNNARWLQEMEELTRRTILVKSDPLLHPEQFDIQ